MKKMRSESCSAGQIPVVVVRNTSTNPAVVSGVVIVYCVFKEPGVITDPNPVVVQVLEYPEVTVPLRSSRFKFAHTLSLAVMATVGAL